MSPSAQAPPAPPLLAGCSLLTAGFPFGACGIGAELVQALIAREQD